jgi:hypothetical protein
VKSNGDPKNSPGSGAGSWLELVRREGSSFNFAVGQIVAHGERMIQIERTEKIRLENPIALSNRADYWFRRPDSWRHEQEYQLNDRDKLEPGCDQTKR